MKKLIALALIVVLAACGKNPEYVPPAPALADNYQTIEVAGQQPAQVVQQPAPVMQAPAPQAAQTNSGPGWGGVIAAGAVGYLLGNSNKPAAAPAPARPVVIYRDAPKPKPVLPITPPRPTTITAVAPPKPQVVTPAPTYAPTTSYAQKQNTPTYSAPPTRSYSVPTTTYRSTTPSRR